ncbi:MAG: N-6 DNA methylase, partial [bacterium]|nr:N-6 DNA methylase [bacterium]
MSLRLNDCEITGPAFPPQFVQFELENLLTKKNLLPKTTGADGEILKQKWESFRRKLRELGSLSGSIRVQHHVIEPLQSRLGYTSIERVAEGVFTSLKEPEDGGFQLIDETTATRLRFWTTEINTDIESPSRKNDAYRYSYLQVAKRVLYATGERFALLTNGSKLYLLLDDPARKESRIIFDLDEWRKQRDVPDSYRLLIALASPAGLKYLPELIEQARLQQSRVTKDLRIQARQAIEQFIQTVLEHPENREYFSQIEDKNQLAKLLWKEGLVLVYRLLFILKTESSENLAQQFSFTSSRIWRETYSPSHLLADLATKQLDGQETGEMLEGGLRQLFRMFVEGIESKELNVKPLGGALFGKEVTPILSEIKWGERAVALLLKNLLWTPRRKNSDIVQRVHYGSLDVEELGRVYEALLELEPGIAPETMCRLRRQKLEVVVPLAQGERYRAVAPVLDVTESDTEEEEEPEEPEEAEEETSSRKKVKVEWIEEIPAEKFYLRVGIGRKATGSYYTPHSFVKFLVQETLTPLIQERSPKEDPHPAELLKLKILDPAMGSGHFLVEACRFLGTALYEAVRTCDERAAKAEANTEVKSDAVAREKAQRDADEYRQRIYALPIESDALMQYLPSHSPTAHETDVAPKKAIALCMRLVAVHCLYGVDLNPLAVELAKLALWLETQSEGLPLTFMDHRLVVGNSLTGPFFEHLLTYPGNKQPLDDLFGKGLREKLSLTLEKALVLNRKLEENIGFETSDITAKESLAKELEQALAPFLALAAAWSGGVMLGRNGCDDSAYQELVKEVAETGTLPVVLPESLRKMMALGLGVALVPEDGGEVVALITSGETKPAFSYDLQFAEVFYPQGLLTERRGFDVVLGNPPWDQLLPLAKTFFASFDFEILNTKSKKDSNAIQNLLLLDSNVNEIYESYLLGFYGNEHIFNRLYKYQIVEIGGEKTIGKPDAFRLFMEKASCILCSNAFVGLVIPSTFHANEGATGIRKLYLEHMSLKKCLSFENTKKLFEIHPSFKFATIVASTLGQTTDFDCAFYLQDYSRLFEDKKLLLKYSLDFVQRTAPDYLNLLELENDEDLNVIEQCYLSSVSFKHHCDSSKILLGRELNITDDIERFSPTSTVIDESLDPRTPEIACELLNQGFLTLHEGKTFHQFTDRWEERPRFLVNVAKLKDKSIWINRARHYSMTYRKIASATNERTSIFSILPAGTINSDNAPLDKNADKHPFYFSLLTLAIGNTYSFDFCLRLRTASCVNKFILDSTPFPKVPIVFSSHSALRLACSHEGYLPLWKEQVGEEWRESKAPLTFPVLASDDERWDVRAAIDAVVAQAYG